MQLLFPHITLQKTFCLLGVLFVHALLPFTEVNPFWKLYAGECSAAATKLASFFFVILVPSFMFASGFLLANSCEHRQRTLTEQLQARVKRLLRPWLLTVLFWLVPLYTLFDLPAFNRPPHATLTEGYSFALRGLFTDHLWFLLVLFWVSLFWLLALPLVRRTNQTAGLVIAMAAAALVRNFEQGPAWFCLWETSAQLLFFYLGCLAYWHRKRIDPLLMHYPLLLLSALTAAVVFLSSYSSASFIATCLISCLGCAFSYLLSLTLARKNYQALRAFAPYRYFEENSFRFYLFHMPTNLLIFNVVNTNTILPIFLQVPVIFILCFAATGLIVMTSHRMEKIFPERP